MQDLGYRRDIDGMRAIAVLAVVFYHVGFSAFGGGYVGVDVFFVISGFLITRLIVDQLDAGTFRFTTFYVRRARRLFPALFVTFLGCFIAAGLLFIPSDMEQFATSLIWAVLSVSNILFWLESGYFDAAAEVKPLLHTWSLSVEEQFYLVWPATLLGLSVVAARLRRQGRSSAAAWTVPVFLIAAGILSLVATEIWLPIDASAAFFLAPFRITEFAIGALMVWVLRLPAARAAAAGPAGEVAAVAGLALIAWPVFAYDEQTVFPGLAALPPCVGTALLLFGGTARWTGAILRNRLAVGLGLISYSLYLVHWPIIVFWTYWIDRPLAPVEQGIVVLASIGLATAMYFFVETPVRRAPQKPRALPPARFALTCAVLAGLLIAPAVTAVASGGWPARWPEAFSLTAQQINDKRVASRVFAETVKGRTGFGGEGARLLVIGDSHGKDAINMLKELAETRGAAIDIVFASIQYECQPFIGPRKQQRRLNDRRIARCNETMRRTIEDGLAAEADFVLLSPRWTQVGVRNAADTIRRIRKQSDARIVILGRTAEFSPAPKLIARHGHKADFPAIAAENRVDLAELNGRLRDIAEEEGALFVSKQDLVCPRADGCHLLGPRTELLVYDYGHWTLDGAQFYAVEAARSGSLDFLFD